jgi:hypothetical protein
VLTDDQKKQQALEIHELSNYDWRFTLLALISSIDFED